MAASSNYSKAWPRERVAVHAAKAWNSEEVVQKSWFHVSVGFGLRRSKPWWLPMIGWHLLMAKGVGKRAEQSKGLYLGCGLRYSWDTAAERDSRDEASWSRCHKKYEVMCDCERWELVSESALSFFRYSSSYNILRKNPFYFFICLSQT